MVDSLQLTRTGLVIRGKYCLSNLDGIGFKRGVVLTEFIQTVPRLTKHRPSPTEEAVVGYVNARLGFDKNGAAVSPLIGPGALALDGTTSNCND